MALVCILLETVAQGILWQAQSPMFALVGITLTGLGYSLVYPALGVEALRRTPPENRGLAMGTYTVFLDISLGLTGPVLGWVASVADLGSIYCVGMCIALFAAAIVLWLLRSAHTTNNYHTV